MEKLEKIRKGFREVEKGGVVRGCKRLKIREKFGRDSNVTQERVKK